MSNSEGFKRLDTLLKAGQELPFEPAPESKDGSSTQPTAAKVRGIPSSRLKDTFENFDLKRNPAMKQALERCQAVSEERAWCAFLAGGYGTGKTHLAIAALMQWYSMRFNGMFWKVPDFLDWLRQQAYSEGYGVEYLTRGYREGYALLVLDDLGTENATDWANEQLYRVLDARYDLKLPTIITTNQEMNRIDGRLTSRYRSGLVVCKGKDIRAEE